ncbi:FUT-1 [Mytilus edulis]|uniref:Fucosyltransferase n=1 Tax=Mytilus edulis TaxID=6550 RepID=A0A8S3VDV8_MYTED|nr:FUT-1 [Mytilus edulis]
MFILTGIGILSIGYHVNTVQNIGTKFRFLAKITRSNTETINTPKLSDNNKMTTNYKEFTKIFTVLWYTKPYWIASYLYKFKFRNCAFNHCELLNNIADLNRSDAVLFHHSEMNSVAIPNKAKNQTWIFMSDESNIHTQKYFMKENGEIILIGHIATDQIQIYIFHTENSHKEVYQNNYIAELKKYIDVDVYGKCGKPCSTWNDDSCFKYLSGDYKFYLAFENSLCEDYVTEKAFRLYQENFNIIPVYRGAPNVKDILPAGTFIPALDFKSPKALAVYLKSVADNEIVYSNYLKEKDKFWAAPYTRLEIVEFIYCSVCEKLSTNYTRGTKLNLTTWIMNKGCRH